jgi:plastocyanin
MKFASRIVPAALFSLALILFAAQARAVEWEVEIENFAFVPQTVNISVGDSVEWRNRDDVQHTSTSNDGLWNSGLLARDQRFSFAFTVPGTYNYHCSPHPTMTGSVIVQGQTGAGDPLPTPAQFAIAPNYPNPFNATTTIGFSLPHSGRVTVEIFNLVGQRLEVLLDETVTVGSHEIIWDAGDRNSGVFFYRVRFDGQTKTGRMALLK